MKTDRVLWLAGLVVAVAVGLWFLHYVGLASAGAIAPSPEPGVTWADEPVGSYTAGVVVCGVIALGCVIGLLWTFRPRREPSPDPPTRDGRPSGERLRPGRLRKP